MENILRSFSIWQDQDQELRARAAARGVTLGVVFREIVESTKYSGTYAPEKVPPRKTKILRAFHIDRKADQRLTNRAFHLGIAKSDLICSILDEALSTPP